MNRAKEEKSDVSFSMQVFYNFDKLYLVNQFSVTVPLQNRPIQTTPTKSKMRSNLTCNLKNNCLFCEETIDPKTYDANQQKLPSHRRNPISMVIFGNIATYKYLPRLSVI